MEDIYTSLTQIADALSKPDQGHCIVLYDQVEYEHNVMFAVIRFRPAGFGSFQKFPPIFYAVVAKGFDRPSELTILNIDKDHLAIREGIEWIDDYMLNLAVSKHEQLTDEMEAIQPGDPIPY